ncbi:MAG: alpha/beta hydrolase, partial [Acinetobacter sp.]|nr:alpha/beta hydrolase [Acinetobacter sp.]
RDKFKSSPAQILKILTKSWYIGAFHLPLLAPIVWSLFSPEKWGKVLTQLERKSNLPLNNNINADGKYGINLYRANFIPRLTDPRQRYAQCPVKAVILKYDTFVSPEYITEAMPKWVEKFEYVELNANHWAILSEPEKIATHIREFIKAQA